jgi:hypothetical protein
MGLGTICNVPLYNIYKKTGFESINFNLSYYQIHYIYIEEVNVANHFSKESII